MFRVTKLTSGLRAWSDRVLLTPVLVGLAQPFRLLWAGLVVIATQIWRFLLRPLWRWVLRPALWLPLRWIGIQTWRFLLRPLWRWVLRPALWLPLRWIGIQTWRFLLRPLWRWVLRPLGLLLRWAGRALLASPRILVRTLPNKGWLAGPLVLVLTAAVLIAPEEANKRTHDRLAQVTAGTTAQSLGVLRPEVTVNLAPFAGWGLEPYEEDRRQLVLKQGEAELRVLREDGVQDAQDHYRWYAKTKLGVSDPGSLYPQHVTVQDSQGRPLRALKIDQTYHVQNRSNHDLDRFHQFVLFNYGTTVLILVLSTSGREPKPLWDQLYDLENSVRITP
jgi:hypothetical protein